MAKPSKVLAMRATREQRHAERTTPTKLPAFPTKNAKLPQMYEEARQALTECSRVDECKDWSDKAAALASYARQSDDESLEKLAVRIRARAIRRAGELLKQFQNQGTRTDLQLRNGAGPKSQRSAAASAGMSKRQEVTAVRIANVPERDFEAAVESDHPPTIPKLSEKGRASLETSRFVKLPQGSGRIN